MPMISRLTIGTKLAIAAALGIVCAITVTINQQMMIGTLTEAKTDLRANTEVVEGVAAAEIAVRRIQIANRDIRLADEGTAITRAMQAIQEADDKGRTTLGVAREHARLPENRERLAAAAGDVAAYAAAVRQIGELRQRIITGMGTQVEIANAWQRDFRALLASPALQAYANRAAVERAAYEADGSIRDSRILMWRFLVTGDQRLSAQFEESVAKAARDLREATTVANGGVIASQIERLIATGPRLKEVMSGIIRDGGEIETILDRRADPVRVRIETAIAATLQAASARQTAVETRMDTAMARGGVLALIANLLIALVLVGTAIFSALTIAKPIRRIAEVLLALANGDKTVNVPYAGRGDEIGDTARAAQTFKDNLARIEGLETEQKAAEQRSATERRAAMMTLADSFERSVGGIVGAVSTAATQLQAAAQTLSSAATETSRQSTAVAAASEEASRSVQTVSAAAEELSASITEIGRQVAQSSTIAGKAVTEAEASNAQVRGLAEAAEKIGSIVSLIDAVAAKTNLLALNATIEAARAGEAGRGFAVVAHEVKGLAEQTARATADIGGQIGAIQGSTTHAAQTIEVIGRTIREINGIAGAIAAAVEEQGAATGEIARNVQQAAEGTTEVSANISGVTDAATQSSAAAAQVLGSAGDLARQSENLRAEVARFLATVRAA